MSIRKRSWRTRGGEEREAWVVDYTDQRGTRHLKTFERKKAAEAWAAATKVEVIKGVHNPARASITVAEAGDNWIAACRAAKLEPATLMQYESHLTHSIKELLGGTKLALLTVPLVADFQARLLKGEDRSRGPASWPLTRKVMASLNSLVAQAQIEGRVSQNAVQEFLRNRRRSSEQRVEDRQRRKLRVGEDIPTVDEVRSILEHAGKWRPLLMTAALTGMRASELRGLTWDNVDFNESIIHVVQRADCFRTIGNPKSRAGNRTIPLTPKLAFALKEWKLACPKGNDNLCFPNRRGGVEWHRGLADGLAAAQIAAKITVDGKAKYTGLHCLRHFFASWCINRKVDGGLELPAKVVSERLGHSSIGITLNTYGHLFPRGDDSAALAEGEAALLR
jgi:integrase